MSQVEYGFTYSVEDINNNVRRTNVLLRAANAIRLSVRDLKQIARSPNLSNVMWTLVQLSRTYNALRRLHRLIVAEANTAGSLMGLTRRIIYVEPTMAPEVGATFDLNALSIRVDAFRENIPMGLPGIDLSNLPEETLIIIQALLEDDADITVSDAKSILVGRILHPEESTGFLESSIYWQPQIDGVRLIAGAPYAWWVERGHHTRGGGYFPGHWYMTGAIDLARQRLPNRIREQLNELILGEP